MKILGISCYYHDAAACLLDDGHLIAAAQEERFTRKKHDDRFPTNAVRYCLAEAGTHDVDAVAFYDKPILKFHRILETNLCTAPRGLRGFVRAVPQWLREKLWIEPNILDALKGCGVTRNPQVLFSTHHLSHAASAFYPSPFSRAAVLSLDGVGEWATATIACGDGRSLRLLKELRFPHSLGLLYSAFTYFTGFRVNSGEYKLMGLAPYGTGTYTGRILEHLIDLKDDGSFKLNMDYFGYLDDVVMTNQRFAALFGGPPRTPESPITAREMNLARSVQEVTEEIVLRIARYARTLTGERYLCMAGGVALNCVANGKLLRSNTFDDLWIQPAAGDAGGAVGAALAAWHGTFEQERTHPPVPDGMSAALLGPEFSAQQIRDYLDAHDYPYTETQSDEEWADELAELLAAQKVVGLFQGRMEFGPRALGNRSILGDPRSATMQSVMNRKIKYRESFRPFAPACLEERVHTAFELDRPSPYMLLVAPVHSDHLLSPPELLDPEDVLARLAAPRSTLPAITHVDGSARVQSVSADTHPRFHSLLRAFESKTGCSMLINTSFNVRGEPIVCTPEDAYRCFMATEMDVLSLGPFILHRDQQPQSGVAGRYTSSFELD